MLHRSVRILVGGDVEPARTAGFDLREVLSDGSPVFLAADLQVEDVDGNLRLLRDANRKVDFAVLFGALAADVGHIDPVVLRHDFCDLDDFFWMFGPAALESRHEPPRTFFHRAGCQLLHPFELADRRRRRVVSDCDKTNLLEGDLRDDIHGDSLLSERLPVTREVGPGAFGIRETISGRDRRAFADDVERHALSHLALGVAVVQQREVGMRMQVDEPRRHDETAGINLARRLRAHQAANRHDAIAADGDIAGEPGIARPVDNVAVAYQQVVRRLLCAERLLSHGRPRKQHGCESKPKCLRHDAVIKPCQWIHAKKVFIPLSQRKDGAAHRFRGRTCQLLRLFVTLRGSSWHTSWIFVFTLWIFVFTEGVRANQICPSGRDRRREPRCGLRQSPTRSATGRAACRLP